MIVMTPEDLEMSRQLQAGYALPEASTDLNARVKAPINATAHTWTHCEIHPSMILGICASIIPFPDHNQVSWTVPLCDRSLTSNSLHVTLTNLLWGSKRWESSLPTTMSEWTLWRTSSITHRNHLLRPDRWSFSSLENYQRVRTRSWRLHVILDTTKKIPSS